MWLARENWTARHWLSPGTDFPWHTGRWSLAFGGQPITTSTAQRWGWLRRARTMQRLALCVQGTRPPLFWACWVSRRWYARATEASCLKLHINCFVQMCLWVWVKEYSRESILGIISDCMEIIRSCQSSLRVLQAWIQGVQWTQVGFQCFW